MSETMRSCGAHEAALRNLLARCEELDVCLHNHEAMAYDGATTRAAWRRSVAAARRALSQTDAATNAGASS